MKTMMLSMLCCLSLSTSCATPAQKRCSALQEQLKHASAPCNECKERLLPEDQHVCANLCTHPQDVAPWAVHACTPEAPASLEPATPATPTPAADYTADDYTADDSE